jgi:hypothetical protein
MQRMLWSLDLLYFSHRFGLFHVRPEASGVAKLIQSSEAIKLDDENRDGL